MVSKLLKATAIASFGAAYVAIVGTTLLLRATLTLVGGPASDAPKTSAP